MTFAAPADACCTQPLECHTRLPPNWRGLTKFAQNERTPGRTCGSLPPLGLLLPNEEKLPAGLNFNRAWFKF